MRQVASRSQRRMEKKQALILLVLMLAVSLASFTLGVMVGRGGAKAPEEAAVAETPVRIPVVKGDDPAEAPAPTPESREDDVAKALTFYDALPKGEQPPLGSGINLPPPEKQKDLGNETKEEKQRPEPKPEPVVTTASKTPAAMPEALPRKAQAGAFLVQVASFRSQEEAARLRDRLAAAGYSAFVEKADLGTKGVWHRVLLGPFAGEASAEQVVSRLKKEEKLSAMVRKR